MSTLKALMSDFYNQRRHRPATTMEIEEFLLCRTGNALLVDAFHRFVYGFDNPPSTPDLWLRDDPAHTGADAWPGRFWDSPDLWVRNSNDGGRTHQAAEYGQDNWFHARVRNRGTTTARHFVVTFNVKPFAGIEFLYPADFLPCAAAAASFELAPGASTIVKARWPKSLVPSAGTHACLTAAVLTRADHPIAGRHVWEHNNLAQKNLTIVDLKPNNWLVVPFVISNFRTLVTRSSQLELIRPQDHPQLEASLLQRSASVFRPKAGLTIEQFDFVSSQAPSDADEQLDCGGQTHSEVDDRSTQMITSDSPELLARQFEQGVEIFFPRGKTAQIPISVRPQEQLLFGLKLKVPPAAPSGRTLHLDLIQRDAKSKRMIGGIAVQIKVL